MALGVALMASFVGQARADKGMWLLNELSRENLAKMKELGFQLSADQLYSLSKPSVASSVVIFGGGCTGVTVSATGLIMTNHHCGFDAIQKTSTVDHDYLRDGFVSQSNSEELPIEGLEVRYLAGMQDVTTQVLAKVKGAKDEMARIKAVQLALLEIRAELEKKAEKNQEVLIVPYYAGNKFYAVTYDVFKDVRMVFAPPSSIGKFGGDTDNWMWPRHTGDFSVFRVYADKNNKPSVYSKENVPFRPKYFAEVSTQGIKNGDYAMTIGFPGSTSRYIPSWGVENRMQNENTARIEVRGAKQAVWRKYMDADQATRIKYASKFARSSNYWKNSIGMNKALTKLGIVERKQEEERAFAKWAASQSKEYQNVLKELETAYKSSGEVTRRFMYTAEVLQGSEALSQAVVLGRMAGVSKADLLEEVKEFYKDYAPELDKATIPVLLDILRKHVTKAEGDKIFATIDQEYKGDTKAYVDMIFAKSIVPYEAKVTEAINKGTLSADLKNDPALLLGSSIVALLTELRAERQSAQVAIEKGNRIYFAGRQIMDPKRPMPSDANFTMRMSYGSVKGYKPADAVEYNYYTTTDGILEKTKQDNPDYYLQPEIIKMLEAGDWGRWADPRSKKLQVAFLSTNDITGGNSGSPVFDKHGRVIGLAFDGNWEAMSGDIEFEPDLQRTISVDIRYVLYVIDKWGKCPRLIQELRLK